MRPALSLKALLLGTLLLACLSACDQASETPSQVEEEESQALELPPAQLTAAEASAVDAMVLPVPPAMIGDLDSMRKTRTVRILVPYSKTFYQVDRGKQQGVAYEYGKALEKWLNQHQPLADKSHGWRVMFIPTARNELLPGCSPGMAIWPPVDSPSLKVACRPWPFQTRSPATYARHSSPDRPRRPSTVWKTCQDRKSSFAPPAAISNTW